MAYWNILSFWQCRVQLFWLVPDMHTLYHYVRTGYPIKFQNKQPIAIFVRLYIFLYILFSIESMNTSNGKIIKWNWRYWNLMFNSPFVQEIQITIGVNRFSGLFVVLITFLFNLKQCYIIFWPKSSLTLYAMMCVNWVWIR